MNEHIQAGRIGAIGASNWTWQRLQEANEYADEHGLVGFTFNSPNLSLAKPNEPFWAGCVSADEDTLVWHERSQFPLLSWSSQARGFFTGRFSPAVRDNADMVRVFYNDSNWERLRRAGELAAEKNVTMVQIALAYVINQPFPTCALIGAQSLEELISCDEGSRIRLTPDEMDWLDLSNEVRSVR
ncbi:putative aldo-keto reductase [compost metagenome]